MKRPLRVLPKILAALAICLASASAPADPPADVPRKVLAFYYPWYGNPEAQGGSGRWSHWEGVDRQAKTIATSTHYPALGPYDSHDRETIAKQCDWAKEAGVDGFIVSWWGKGSFSDRAMGPILAECQKAGLDVTVYFESVPRPTTPEKAAEDLGGVLEAYGSHPAWLRARDKPVVFVYGRAVTEIGLEGWMEAARRVNEAHPAGAVLIGDRLSDASATVFDGIHTYNTAAQLRGKSVEEARQWAADIYPKWVAMADRLGRISTITVIPGYDDTKIRRPGLAVPRAGGELYRAEWEEAIEADPHWVLVTSWNEWHEGSEIEPSAEDGTKYLEMTAEFTARFKAREPRHAPDSVASTGGITPGERAALAGRLKGGKVVLLPGFDLRAVWPLFRVPERPMLLTGEQVASLGPSSVPEYPVLIYAGGEQYRRTVHTPGDVDAGLLRYLKAGGLLMVVPSGPMPLHFDREGKTVATARKLGLPLSVGGPSGGWEEPPEGVTLRFVQPERRLPHVPAEFPFPTEGDRRWRPLVRAELAERDVYVPLLELRDAAGKHYGDAAGYIEHRTGEPKGGRILYAWFGLFGGPGGEALLWDLLGFAAEQL